jgi:soluble lytic murein transglycosylase
MMIIQTVKGLLLTLAALGAMTAPAAAAFLVDEESQRRDYTAAVEALRLGNITRFKALSERVQGYVLHPYLDYEFLKDRLAVTPAAEIRRFLEESAAAPVSDNVRKKWLRQLAARGDWDAFLRDYREIENDPELTCLRLNRLLKASESQAPLMTEIAALWLTGKRLPGACDPVFAAWKAAGHMTGDKVWERIRLAMERRQTGLAGELAGYLEPKERVWVNRWIEMHRNPLGELTQFRYPVETPTARMIIRHGVVRLAYRDPETAMQQWERLKAKYQFFGEDDNYVLRHVGILAAQNHLPEALKWLAAVSADANDESLHLWRVRAALRVGEWETAKRFVAGLSEDQQKQPQWRYWKARILDETSQKREAEKLYTNLARERGYYGFLAADRLGAEYSMQHQAIEATPEEVSAMLARPGIQMAQELYTLGNIVEARRQWQWTTRRMNNRELQVAAVLAGQWGWHDRAILTVSKSEHQDDLELRFPLLYRDLIETYAARQGLDAGWVYGVVRQESAFVVDARSEAGALGLMQLMPATGRLTGRRLNIAAESTHSILDIQNNLRLGAGYLKEMLDRYRGNQVLATASYNAGPNRITEWLENGEALDAEIWVETIPYNETRDYVKNVLAYTTVYENRLGGRTTRLKSRMPAVALPSK